MASAGTYRRRRLKNWVLSPQFSPSYQRHGPLSNMLPGTTWVSLSNGISFHPMTWAGFTSVTDGHTDILTDVLLPCASVQNHQFRPKTNFLCPYRLGATASAFTVSAPGLLGIGTIRRQHLLAVHFGATPLSMYAIMTGPVNNCLLFALSFLT